jgi:hypothetical protein
MFVDDTGLNTVRARLSGWGPRGERVLGAVPQSHWETSTWVLAVRQAELAAPMVTAGAMTGALFLAYVTTYLCPTLADGDLLICDNPAVHQAATPMRPVERPCNRSRLTARTSTPLNRSFPN